MTRFVVLRQFRGLQVWYVEADDEAAALEQVWPEEPERHPAYRDQGGMVPPHLEVHLETGADMRVHPIRRFPANFATVDPAEFSRS